MASLNWAILDSSNRPVPLPQEKSLLHLSSVSLSLFPSHPGQSTNSKPLPTDTHYTAEKGHVYLSNQRVVYVAPSNSTSGEQSSSFETLSVPYTHFRDGHLHQPWLGANYYQAICIPAREGGLSVRFPFFPLFFHLELTPECKLIVPSCDKVDVQRRWRV